jgi:hypothetical protein
VRGISKGDVIDVATQGARRFAKRLVEASGNSTLRIWTDDIDTSAVRHERSLELRGCEVRQRARARSSWRSACSPSWTIREVLRLGQQKAPRDDRWDFEEACIAHEDQ